MKHLAKDIWIHKPDSLNFELIRKWHTRDKDNNLKYDDNGNLKESSATVGYYSNFDRVWSAIADLGYAEYVNNSLNECVRFINEASKNMKKYINESKHNS